MRIRSRSNQIASAEFPKYDGSRNLPPRNDALRLRFLKYDVSGNSPPRNDVARWSMDDGLQTTLPQFRLVSLQSSIFQPHSVVLSAFVKAFWQKTSCLIKKYPIDVS